MTFRKYAALSAFAVTAALASSAGAQTVLNTSLADVTGTYGAGVATTTTDSHGTVTTVAGPAGGANRATASAPAGVWYQSDVGGGGSVGITDTYSRNGNGAAYFAGTGPGSKADLVYGLSAPVALSTLTSMSFDFIHSSGDDYSPVMRLIVTKDGAYAGQLIYEYTYQSNPFTMAPADVWTTMAADLNTGIFWYSGNGSIGPTQAAANGGEKTLAAWIAGNAGSTISVVGVDIGVGSGWPTPYSDAIDNVKFNFTGGPSGNFDFAVAGVVPEPASWALMIAGFGLAGAVMRRRRSAAATTAA